MPIILTIISGAVGAAFYGLTAYKKAKKAEKFDWKKFGPVVILGGVIGGVAGWQNLDYNLVVDASWTGYAAIVVENGWKWFWRKILKKD